MRLRQVVILLLSALAILPLATAGHAQRERLDAAFEKLAADSFGDTVAAIEDIVASNAANGPELLEAIAGGRLLLDAAARKVYLRGADDKLVDARTGAAAGAGGDLKPVRLNNRVRSVVQAALGSVGILHSDPARRRAAAAAVLKSRDANALAALETAIAREPNRGIAATMQAAKASIMLAKPDSSQAELVEAVQTLERYGGQDALTVLRSASASAGSDVAEAAQRAVKTIESRQAWWAIGQTLWYGLSLGSVLLLAAIGLAITFGVMGVINMAHGEMVMLGAYTTFVVQEIIRANAPWLFDWSLAIAIPLAFLAAGAAGVAIERGVIRFLYGRPLETLLATWGLSLILQQAVRTAFGPTNREVGTPSFMSGGFELGGLAFTWNRLAIVIFAALIFAGLLAVLKRTALGLDMRAVTQNRRMAASMGINTARVDALTFGLGSGIAGLAGVALSQIDNVSPNLGQSYIIDSFLVVVFGGVGNLWGTLVGALTLGIANKLLEPFAGAVLGKILLLVAIILFIQRRPRGLFALKGRAVEA